VTLLCEENIKLDKFSKLIKISECLLLEHYKAFITLATILLL